MSPEQPAAGSWFGQHRILLGSVLAGFVLLGAAATVVLGLWTSPPSASALATATPSPSAIPTLEPTPTAEPTPTPNPFNRALLNNRYTVLVIGEDSNLIREARGQWSRTDTIMVVSISPRQKKIAMASVPRDTVDIPLADGGLYTGKINGIAHELGYEGLVGAIETLLDIEIDAYVKVDMDNFAQLVDAAGGIKVTNAYALYDAHLQLALPAGEVRLDGETALDYVRTRVDSDYARAARQQQVLQTLVRKFVNTRGDWEITQILPVLDSLQTDIELADMPTLLRMARMAQDAKVTQIVLSPPRFSLGWGDQGDGRGWIIIPNVAEMRAYAASVMGGD